jgi:FkbM family methyltransferase
MSALWVRQNAKGVKTFIDVGANYGFYDVLVGRSNPQCKILAFEPIAANADILRRNLELSNIQADIFQVAVSDRPGRTAFQVSEASDNSGFVANPNAQILETIDVEVVALDQSIDCIAEGPVLVKIDTEGNEVKVLEGMRRIIEKIDDLRLIVEFNPECLRINGASPELLLETIDRLGFDVHFILDEEKRYEKYRPGTDWQKHLGEKTYRNIVCVKKSRSLHLCIFTHAAGIAGGAERAVFEVVEHLTAKQGVFCTVVLFSDGDSRAKFEELGAATFLIPYEWWCASLPFEEHKKNASMLASYQSVFGQMAAFERACLDVVLTNTLVVPWGAVMAWHLDCPHIWLVHEYGELDHNLKFFFLFPKILDFVRESSNHILVNSDAVKKTLFGGLGLDQCTTVTYDVPLHEASKTNRLFFTYPSSTKLLISGNVSKSKGQDDAVLAALRLLAEGRDIELCIIGPVTRPFTEELKNLVQNEKREDRIRFLGYVESVRQVIEQADIALTCSKCEAFGRVTAEALLLGKPVIGTNTGGTVDLIEEGVDGFLYSPGNIDQLVEKISFFIDSPEKIREFGERGRENILKKLAANPANTAIYKKCLEVKRDHNPHSPQLARLMMDWLREMLRTRDVCITEQQCQIQTLETRIAEQDRQVQTLSETLTAQTQTLTAQIAERELELAAIKNSKAWKVALLLRRIRTKIRIG